MQQHLPSICSHLTSKSPLTKESDLLSTVVDELSKAGACMFWTAESQRARLQAGSAWRRSYRLTKSYDVSWSSQPATTKPTDLCQLKLARRGRQQTQEVLLFLGDVAFAALDHHLSLGRGHHQTFHAMVAVPAQAIASSKHWSPMFALRTPTQLRLDPCMIGLKSALVPPSTNTIQPSTTQQYSKIFCAGTNGRLVGLFKRAGSLAIDLSVAVQHPSTTGYSLLLMTVTRVHFTGPDLEAWWP